MCPHVFVLLGNDRIRKIVFVVKQIVNNPRIAFPLAEVAIEVAAAHPTFLSVLLVHFHKVIVPTVEFVAAAHPSFLSVLFAHFHKVLVPPV